MITMRPFLKKLFGRRDSIKKLDMEISSVGNCAFCHKPITDVHPDEVKMVSDGPVHDDCYFDEFSKELDKHPIGIPRMHR